MTMTCRAWEDLLQRHLDGEPPEALRRHLLDCPHCVAREPALTRLLAGVARMKMPALPTRLTDRLTGLLMTEARTRKRTRWRVRVAVLAAAAALLVAVGLYSWPRPAKDRPVD